MSTVIHNIAIDCADPYRLAQFWSAVLDRPLVDAEPGDPELSLPLTDSQNLYFQAVPEPKNGKNRLHVCLCPDRPRDEEVERLLALGATLSEDHRRSDGSGWAVLLDIEGNEFCVLRSAAERHA
ncbi:VOC family protein [Stackebrandtia soli]|uniref:VOC family protein n=1 Tax=Stackebrandtia soli TaxID=1892856 RepID=UPI0039E7B073